MFDGGTFFTNHFGVFTSGIRMRKFVVGAGKVAVKMAQPGRNHIGYLEDQNYPKPFNRSLQQKPFQIQNSQVLFRKIIVPAFTTAPRSKSSALHPPKPHTQPQSRLAPPPANLHIKKFPDHQTQTTTTARRPTTNLTANTSSFFSTTATMHLMYTLDAEGTRVYTLKKINGGEVTKSAHPARFSPDDKYSRHRVTLKKRYGLLLTQQKDLKVLGQ
ncbi:hypothetical protein V501_04261 [Pseudogymnoascus sp. VKM F-4519 (FW-2642)]|nr:hypothetical protein V501_04261 [Pseudogymnoascus sp. VKM F-4519 (FW-2642)]